MKFSPPIGAVIGQDDARLSCTQASRALSREKHPQLQAIVSVVAGPDPANRHTVVSSSSVELISMRARTAFARQVNQREPSLSISDVENALIALANALETKLDEAYAQARQKRQDEAASGGGDLRPVLNAANQDLPDITKQAWKAIIDANQPPSVFVHGTDMVTLVTEKNEPPRLESFNEALMRHALAEATRWAELPSEELLAALGVTLDDFPIEIVYPPSEVAKDMLVYTQKPLPKLTRIVSTPVFTADERLITAPGFDAESGIFFAPTAKLKALDAVPSDPTRDDIHQALEAWDDVLVDFPFDGSYSRGHAMALALGVVSRDLIEGATPLHLVAKHQPRTGATLLTDVLLYPALGQWPGRTSIERSDDAEMDKALLSVLRDGAQVFLLDNLRRMLSSATLSKALTDRVFEGRLLGHSLWLKLPVRLIFAATGNNPKLSSELVGRTVRIGLDPLDERPGERTGFRHKHLQTYVRQRWPQLVWANLTLVNGYLRAGKPGPADGVPNFGMFEDWRDFMGGLVNFYGFGDFLADRNELRAEHDAEITIERAFVGRWWELFKTRHVTATDLVIPAQETGADIGDNERGQTRKLAAWLGTLAGQIIRCEFTEGRLGPLVSIVRGTRANTGQTWFLRVVDEAKPPPQARETDNGTSECVSVVSVAPPVGSGESATTYPPTVTPTVTPGVSVDVPADRYVVARTPKPTGGATLTTLTHSLPENGTAKPKKVRKPKLAEGEQAYPDATFELVQTPESFVEACAWLAQAQVIGLDGEMTGLQTAAGHRQRLLQLAGLVADRRRVFVVDLDRGVDLVKPLDQLFASGAVFVIQEAPFDLGWLRYQGCKLPPSEKFFDTRIAAAVTEQSGAPGRKYTLDSLVWQFLEYRLPKELQLSDWSAAVLSDEQLQYAANDAACLLELHAVLSARITEYGREQVFELETILTRPIIQLRSNGVPFDVPLLKERTAVAGQLRDAAHDALHELAGTVPEVHKGGKSASKKDLAARLDTEHNWNSPPQNRAWFAARGVELESVDKATLVALHHPVGDQLLEWRAAQKLASYGEQVLEKAIVGDRGYGSFTQLGTTTGRMSCRAPNLQQMNRGRHYRETVRARDGYTLVKCDYAALQMRIAAEISGDPELLTLFLQGGDPHDLTAQRILGSVLARQAAKAINFGLLFGAGAATLRASARTGYGVELTLEQATEYREAFFDLYRGLRNWHQQWKHSRKAPLDVPDPSGSGRWRMKVLKYTERINTPVQMVESHGVKRAMLRLYNERSRFPRALQVIVAHDEFLYEAPLEQAADVGDWLAEVLRSEMQPLVASIPIVVDTTIYPTWWKPKEGVPDQVLLSELEDEDEETTDTVIE